MSSASAAAATTRGGARRRIGTVVGATTTGTPTTATSAEDLPKNFNQSGDAETALYATWEAEGCFRPEANSASNPSSSTTTANLPPFTIPMPPPNVTGRLHMGHAMFVALQDVMARYRRMRGHPTLWLPGTDHAGIATQLVVEKDLAAQGEPGRTEMGREAFTERVWSWKQQYGSAITSQMRRLGASCDWSRERFTLDEGLSDAVYEAFLRLHNDDLIYRDSYMVNWSVSLQTAVSDLEVEYAEENGSMYTFRYPVDDDTTKHVEVATTRPETIFGDTAVAVNPNDERYSHLVGKEAVIPLNGRRIPIIADEYVDMEFGTGVVKITPGHDINDYEVGRRNKLLIVNIYNNDATLNANCGNDKFVGMERFDARKAVWKELETLDLAIERKDHVSRIPRSQRGGDVIEPIVSEQWFVRAAPLAEPALAAVTETKETEIIPERYNKIYEGWLTEIKDWCISRQLWWGHRIPVYYVFDSEDAANDAEKSKFSGCTAYVVARSEDEAKEKAAEKDLAASAEAAVVRQDPDVLDTWFSSALWPFSTLGWPNETPDLEKFYPTTMMETGHDILFFWVARMMMMGCYLTGRPPFKTIYLHGLVRDEKGRKMSKSLGNVTDPIDTIEEFGADALRYTLATGTTPGNDVNLNPDKVKTNYQLTNKIWNAGKYVLFRGGQVDGGIPPPPSLAAGVADVDAMREEFPRLSERYIVSAANDAVRRSTDAHERYDFGEAGRIAYEFFYNEFADWYIEASKTRFLDATGDAESARSAAAAMTFALDVSLRLFHPFMPFVTEDLHSRLPWNAESPRLMNTHWPATDGVVDTEAMEQFSALQEVVKAIRNARAEYNVDPNKKLTGAKVLVDSETLANAMAPEADVMALLCKLENVELVIGKEASAEAASAAGSSGDLVLIVRDGMSATLPLSDLVDKEKEMDRITKRIAKATKERDGLAGRLNSPKFVDKAPANVVEKAREEKRELDEVIASLEARLKEVEAM
ncbi:valine--tRNA ligase [Pseudoscourfieldia marina]